MRYVFSDGNVMTVRDMSKFTHGLANTNVVNKKANTKTILRALTTCGSAGTAAWKRHKVIRNANDAAKAAATGILNSN